ncbi:ABC transporter substrate-binding protein [Pseudomonas sp. AOB-7]|uniref:substrate-binding periplasmic protein n=1 Tax=Pseudomonas sp. AOB-7 TaxID=2482750 RepID=UPI000EFAC391|nr:transporter substrate-binding domain-containing protein [Pseudomonas sp. AOB-7]RMH87080.1 ABC transporter substrate-binding protein [Pseudomonas sp. AOB-7]
MPPLALLACLLLLTCALAQAEPGPRLATLEYPPYASQQLDDGGSIVALTRRAFALRGYAAHIDFLPWARVRAELRNGTYQGALALWPREIGEEGLIASRPLFYSELGLFVRQGHELRFQRLQQLAGQKLGIVRGYGYPQRILDAGLVLEEAVDDISNLRKLHAGRFDLVLLERRVGEYLIAGDPQLHGQLRWHGRALERIPLLVGFVPAQPGQTDWSAIFEQGLRDLHASGEYMQILRRHSANP